MTALHGHAGQVVMVGFDGSEAPVELRALAREWDLGGVVLFKRNVEAPEQVAELAFEVGGLARETPLWVGIDQEGGRVARLREPFTEWPAMAHLGRHGGDDLADRFARALAAELSAVGVNLDFAPVLDLHNEAADPVIGDRALSSDAGTAGRLGAAIVRGLQAGGVAACAKHFPGHGDARVDSHRELPVVEHGPERLRAHEMAPFRAAAAADAAAVMTAHVVYPALDEERPATLSRTVVDGILRRECGHRGLVLTDDLEMGAITADRSVERAAVEALAAGCDALLVCGPSVERHASVIEAIIHAVETGDLDVRRVEEARARQQRVKAAHLAGDRPRRPLPRRRIMERIGCAEHRSVAAAMARA